MKFTFEIVIVSPSFGKAKHWKGDLKLPVMSIELISLSFMYMKFTETWIHTCNRNCNEKHPYVWKL